MSQLHYALVTFGAVFSTLVLPIPEEVTLLGAGYLARAGKLGFWLALAAAYAAIVAGDAITFFAARFFLPKVLDRKWVKKLLPPKTQAWAEGLVARHGTWTIVIARFLVGLRGPVYAALGASPYPSGRFMVINSAVGVVEVGALVFAGWLLGPSDRLVHGVREIELATAAILIFTFAMPLLLKRWLGHKQAHA
jgi:membrane protein DedA with SNARE-associated domain